MVRGIMAMVILHQPLNIVKKRKEKTKIELDNSRW